MSRSPSKDFGQTYKAFKSLTNRLDPEYCSSVNGGDFLFMLCNRCFRSTIKYLLPVTRKLLKKDLNSLSTR